MKAHQRGPVRRVAASTAVILATLVLTSAPAAQAEQVGGGTETDSTVVRTPQFAECDYAHTDV
ncbi:hypothetical protein AB0M50_07050 [Nonomuraea fuscirosea]|jgi:hypothetical protein|uniref:hypothetical protein n=1 Tax=Nonomuraea fuscirosea TaxID=1291556 RepID=UPI002DD99178|nr:hypothetical protein [Nonomuraea fuscirosea]WSA50302.1 hypothetical protein OIE67_40545 [Nonomuraea fuscirosea]